MASSASGSAAGRPTAASTALKPDPRRKELLALFNRQVEVLLATAKTLNGVGKRGKASGITFPFQALPDAGLPMDMLSRVGRVCRGHDDSLRLEFPPSLNSFDRMLVHEVCTSKDVTHESSGDGSDRRIVVCAALVAAPPAKQPEPPVERITAHTTLFQALGAEAELSADADQGVEGGSDGIHLDASVVLEGSAGDVPIPGDDADDEVASDACEPIAAPSSVPDGATPAVAAVAAVPLEGKNLLAALAAERAARAKPVVKPPPVPAPPQGTSLSALGLAGSGKVGKAGGGGGKSGKGPKPAATGPMDKSKYLGVACTGVKDLPSALVKGIEGEGGKGKKKKDGAKEEEVDPDMALLDAVIADARVCGARGCKKSVLTLSSLCPHCRLRFCFTHGQVCLCVRRCASTGVCVWHCVRVRAFDVTRIPWYCAVYQSSVRGVHVNIL